jgi:hypothetical protein
MVSDTLVVKFSEAIAKAEGFYVPNSVPARAHNPGDLTDDGDVGLGFIQTAGSFGAKITVYATDADGWTALYKKVRRMLNGASKVYTLDMTLMEVAIKYSGDAAWATNVAKDLGVDTRTSLAQLAFLDSQRQA